jgi:hypothetical protein
MSRYITRGDLETTHMRGEKNDTLGLATHRFNAVPPLTLNDKTSCGGIVPKPNGRQLHERFTVLRHRFVQKLPTILGVLANTAGD